MAFAGVALEISFARFMASTAAFSKERASSRRFCCLELLASMSRVVVAGRKRCSVQAVRKDPN